MSRSFLTADIDKLVKQLKVDEKIALLSAPNWWNTTSIPRLGIPSVRMSDGPNGVRGSSHFVSTPAQCIPCATSLASTFDPELIYQAGVFLAKEAKVKSSVILLAPTCNIQRSPLGGRAFESFSEDPHLSGTMAAAYVNGLQSEGVSATIKHFVANDQEHERTAAESIMSERTLREIYLYPFMLAQKHAHPWAYMTAYGRIKGIHCSENRELLTGILRNEWKFDGLIVSDWFGTYGVDGAINAGLDLEMPGPPRWRTPLLMLQCLSARKLLASTIDDRVANLLRFVQRQARRNPEVVYGDGIERSRDTPEARQFCRNLAAEGIVLLKNQNGVLPLIQPGKRRILVTGPNAKGSIISGGGSAALKPTYTVTPWAGINQAAPKNFEINYTVGCYAHKYLPTLESQLVTHTGQAGWLCTFYSHDAEDNPSVQVGSFVLNDTRVKLNDFLPQGLTTSWSIQLEGKLTVDTSGLFELGLTVAGRAKLWLDGELIIDNWTKQTAGDFFYGQGTIEEKATVNLTAGKPVDVRVEYTNTPPPDGEDENGERRLAQPALMKGVRLGGCPKIDPDEAISEALSLARDADAVIFVGGLSPEWESEGFDRPSLALPGQQDELIAKLAGVNPNVVVCMQAGSAVSMPWIDKIVGLLQTWYSGNEVGNALADVLFGNVNPGGRLPLTFPVKEEDIPAFLNERAEDGKIHYREDLYVGYKYYQARAVKPLFSFGFGLSYTTFSLSDLNFTKLALNGEADNIRIQTEVTIHNQGERTGSEVVQLYISYPSNGPSTPKYQLRGFCKGRNIVPGAARKVHIELDKFAFAHWDEATHMWRVNPGTYGIHVGSNSAQLVCHENLEIPKGFSWSGL